MTVIPAISQAQNTLSDTGPDSSTVIFAGCIPGLICIAICLCICGLLRHSNNHPRRSNSSQVEPRVLLVRQSNDKSLYEPPPSYYGAQVQGTALPSYTEVIIQESDQMQESIDK